jgi:hypothetical protein
LGGKYYTHQPRECFANELKKIDALPHCMARKSGTGTAVPGAQGRD